MRFVDQADALEQRPEACSCTMDVADRDEPRLAGLDAYGERREGRNQDATQHYPAWRMRSHTTRVKMRDAYIKLRQYLIKYIKLAERVSTVFHVPMCSRYFSHVTNKIL